MNKLGVHQKTIYVFIDTETAGLDLLRHGIIQIGAYATGTSENELYGTFLEDANPLIDEDYARRPEGAMLTEIDDQALNVNKFTRHRIDYAEPLVNVLCRFVAWMKKLREYGTVVPVFHNALFDVPRLEVAMKHMSVPGFSELFRRPLCTVSIAYSKCDTEPQSLRRLAVKYGITNHVAHTSALMDAITTSKVFHAMMVPTLPPFAHPQTFVPSTLRFSDTVMASGFMRSPDFTDPEVVKVLDAILKINEAPTPSERAQATADARKALNAATAAPDPEMGGGA